MNILKQNSDYALRIMANLAVHYDGKTVISTGTLASEEDVSPQFAAKILQKLAKAGLITSTMGPTGGFKLAKKTNQISLYNIIEAMQGPIAVNKCSPGLRNCPKQPTCPIADVLIDIEGDIKSRFDGINLSDILERIK